MLNASVVVNEVSISTIFRHGENEQLRVRFECGPVANTRDHRDPEVFELIWVAFRRHHKQLLNPKRGPYPLHQSQALNYDQLTNNPSKLLRTKKSQQRNPFRHKPLTKQSTLNLNLIPVIRQAMKSKAFQQRSRAHPMSYSLTSRHFYSSLTYKLSSSITPWVNLR